MWAFLFLVGLSVLAVVVAIYLGKLRLSNESRAWPLYGRKPLSDPEQVLYFRLREALPECIVLAQVEISRVIGIKRGPAHGRMRNILRGMSVDFVICLKDSTVVCAIELDDSSHETEKGRARHEKKSHAFESAGISLIRWRVAALPSVLEIRRAIAH